MKIGIVSFYPWRPHIEHMTYLANLLEEAGHEVFYLTCDSQVSTCYPKKLHTDSGVKSCVKCRLGGVRSYKNKNITSLSKDPQGTLSEEELYKLTASSSYTLHRTESLEDRNAADVINTQKELARTVNKVVENAKSWIEDNQLEGLICFNGRMDMLSAAIFAAKSQGIPYLTVERTLAGHGLMIKVNENCLGLKGVANILTEFDDKPLNKMQAELAAHHLASRFIGKNVLEWRVYNQDRVKTCWPIKADGLKVLFLPSSKCEFAADEQRDVGIDEHNLCEEVVSFLGSPLNELVVRAHPNWATKVGSVKNTSAETYYQAWVERTGVHYINSESNANTYDLIAEADVVIVNGSTSALEAAACGKKVVCIGESFYTASSFVSVVNSKHDIANINFLEPREIIKSCLRSVYSTLGRVSQYVDFVRASSSTKYKYFEGADPDRLISMLKTGKLEVDDKSYASTYDEEDAIIDIMMTRKWDRIFTTLMPTVSALGASTPELKVRRRLMYSWVSKLREQFQVGISSH